MNGGLFQLLKAQGQEFFGQLAGALMSDPRFMRAMERAWQGKAALESAAARALKEMNIPTRTEFQKAVKRIEALEARLAAAEEALTAAAAAPAAEPEPTPEKREKAQKPEKGRPAKKGKKGKGKRKEKERE